MGLYDDDLESARASEGYRAAGRLAGALNSASPVPELSAAVEALEAFDAEFPGLPDSDASFKAWRALSVRVGRALREAAAPGWETFAGAHPSFVRLLDARDGMKRFETTGRLGYQLWHPEHWRTRVSDNEASFAASPDSGFNEFFAVLMEELPFQPTLERFAAYAIERLRRDIPGCSITERRFRRLDRTDAFEMDYADPAIRGRVVLAIHGNTALTLSCQAASERFAVLEPAVGEIVESFRLKGLNG